MVAKKISVAPETVIELPAETVIHQCGEDFVVVSPKDGNWLVVSEEQLHVFEQLKMGQTIGEVVSTKAATKIATSLLKQIFARNFTERNLSLSNRNAKALFYITYDYNLQCEHCYMYAQRSRGRMLSAGEYRTIFEGLSHNGIKEVTFTGGEPLMRPDLWEIIKNACDAGLSAKIFSNGTLWDDSDIEKAREFAIKVQISIDGVDESSSSAIRDAGVFAKAKNVAIRLSESGVDVEIATTPTLANIEAIENEFSSFVKEMCEKGGPKIKSVDGVEYVKIHVEPMTGRKMAYLGQNQDLYVRSNSSVMKLVGEDRDNYRDERIAKSRGI